MKLSRQTSFFIVLLLLVVILWASSFLLLQLGEGGRGTFGDMFGMVNALFTGLAFAGVVYTLLQQNTLIDQQQKSIEIQKEELALTRQEFHDQTNTFRQQSFESTFFNLLKMHTDTINGMVLFKYEDIDCNSFERVVGKEVVHKFNLYVAERYNDIGISAVGEAVWGFESYIEYYSISIQGLFTYIEASNYVNKAKYIEIIKRSISIDEIQMLFLYAMYEGGRLKEIINTYSLLEFCREIDVDELIEAYLFDEDIKPTAFGLTEWPEYIKERFKN